MNSFPNERLRIKLFVYIVFALEVVQTVMLTKSLFDIFGYGFGDPRAYDRVGSIWFSVPFISGIGLCSIHLTRSCPWPILRTDVLKLYSGIFDAAFLRRTSAQTVQLLQSSNCGFCGMSMS